jgi:hypothetical protein
LVNSLAQSFARFEMGHAFFWNLHAFARSGVAPKAGWPAIDGETAESANFDAMAFDQSFAHGVQHRFDSEFGVTVSQLLKASSQGFNEVGSSHVKNVREA